MNKSFFKIEKDLFGNTIKDKNYIDIPEYTKIEINNFKYNFEEIICIDLETSGLKPYKQGHKIICISITDKNKTIVFNKDFDKLKNILETKKVIAHKITFENDWITHIWKINIKNWFWDTKICHHILDNTDKTGLKYLINKFFGIPDYSVNIEKYLKAENSNGFNRIEEAPKDDLYKYNGHDSYFTYKLYELQKEKLDKHLKKGFDFFMEAQPHFSIIQQNGINFDEKKYETNYDELTKRMEVLNKQIQNSNEVKDYKDFNFNSSKQLRELFFDKLKLDSVKKTNGNSDSVDEEVLNKLNTNFSKRILKHRYYAKIRDTYLKQFKTESYNNFIHPFFDINTTSTYRSSSYNPNFQNIPVRDEYAKQITRGCLIPRLNQRLLEIDFKGIEVGIGTCVTKDTMIETTEGSKSIFDIIENLKLKKEIFVFGYDFNKKRIAINKVLKGGITGIKKEVWQVELDNGSIIKATPEHQFLLRNEKYIELKNLKVNDSLMPFYKTTKKSNWKTVYNKIYLNNGKSILEHNLIALDVFNIDINKENKVVHHKNHIGTDNSFNNIEIMSRKEHMKIHSKEGWDHDKENRIKKRNNEHLKFAFKNWYTNLSKQEKEEYKKRCKDRFKNRNIKGNNNPMFGKTHSLESKEKNRKSHLGKKSPNKGKPLSLIHKQKISKANKGKFPSIETKIKISNSLKGRKFSEETIEKFKNKIWSKNTRKKLSDNKTKYWKNRKSQSKIQCKICNQYFYSITNTHLKKHNLTLEFYKKNNHQVKSIKFFGYEDVYNLNIETSHNYAITNGVIIKNCYHKDTNMINYVMNKENDMHRDVAADIFIKHKKLISKVERFNAKNGFVFPSFYGSTSRMYNDELTNQGYGELTYNLYELCNDEIKLELNNKGIKTIFDFQDHIEKIENKFWKETFPEYQQWKFDNWKEYKKNGFIELYTGFRCVGKMSFNQVNNFRVQGTAFHVMLWCLIQINKFLISNKMKTMIIGQVHDSIVFDIYNDYELEILKPVIKDICTKKVREHFEWIIVPLEIEAEITGINESWDMKKEIKL